MGYELALGDLEAVVKPEVFSYLLSIFNEETHKEAVKAGKQGIKKIITSQSSGRSTASVMEKYCDHLPASQNTISSTGNESRLYLSSLKPSQRSISPTALCSHLPICRKILFKHGHRGETTKKTKEYFEETPTVRLSETKELPFKSIIGKINQSEPHEFERGRKLSKPAAGVREFTHTISNPLYRNYNPKGYIKNDDEIAREFIKKITTNFNQWLQSFDGVLAQLDPDVMIKILRDDLEHSFQCSTLEQESQSEPVVYKSRFRFDQPSIKLTLT